MQECRSSEVEERWSGTKSQAKPDREWTRIGNANGHEWELRIDANGHEDTGQSAYAKPTAGKLQIYEDRREALKQNATA